MSMNVAAQKALMSSGGAANDFAGLELATWSKLFGELIDRRGQGRGSIDFYGYWSS
ncbi:MAG: hypothetical protein IPO77_21350 [Acidobacteria bacterium]|nr:hypothetical protein [Acidobacteriota bacterium]